MKIDRRFDGSWWVRVVGPSRIDMHSVTLVPEAMDLPDERVLAPAVAVLNRATASWPGSTVTVEQVRELAEAL